MIIVKDILSAIKHSEFIGDDKTVILAPVQAASSDIGSNHLLWVSDKNLNYLTKINLGTIICSSVADKSAFKKECNYIIVENPRLIFQKILSLFFIENTDVFISPTAQIHSSCKTGKNLFIGHGVVIEKECVIGDNVVIGHNTVVFKNTLIENGVRIGANCTIGGLGFGYEKDEEGLYQFIPHLGNVTICEGAEIGNNTAIDRAVLGSTLVGKNCKIDNLVHVAHGVQLGNNSLVIANAMVAGSVSIGENVWVAPSSSILNNKSVGNNAIIGMGAVVLKDVDANQVIVGNPGKPLRFH